MAHCARKHCTAEDNHMVISGISQTTPDVHRDVAYVIQHWAAIGCCRCPHTNERHICPGYQGHTILHGTQSSHPYHLAYERVQPWLFDDTVPGVESLDFGQVWFYTNNLMS